MRYLLPAAFWLAVTGATLFGQAPGEGRLQPLPLTQLDERALGADLGPSHLQPVARVADGETLVLGGFTRRRETRQRQNAGTRGGWFGRSTVVTRKHVELVILLTPRILRPVGAP